MFEAVIFDCDGVLVDSEALALDVELDFLASKGLIYDRADFARRFIGMDSRAMDDALRTDSLTQTGTAFEQIVMDDMRANRDALFARELKAIAGAKDSLTAFAGKRAIASSSRIAHLKTNLTRTGLDQLAYPHVYSAEQVQAGKPSPDVFLHAAAQIGAAPSRCLVIEDSINGVRAGVAAGMTVWGFLGGGHVWPELSGQLRSVGATEILADHAAVTARLSAF